MRRGLPTHRVQPLPLPPDACDFPAGGLWWPNGQNPLSHKCSPNNALLPMAVGHEHGRSGCWRVPLLPPEGPSIRPDRRASQPWLRVPHTPAGVAECPWRAGVPRRGCAMRQSAGDGQASGERKYCQATSRRRPGCSQTDGHCGDYQRRRAGCIGCIGSQRAGRFQGARWTRARLPPCVRSLGCARTGYADACTFAGEMPACRPMGRSPPVPDRGGRHGHRRCGGVRPTGATRWVLSSRKPACTVFAYWAGPVFADHCLLVSRAILIQCFYRLCRQRAWAWAFRAGGRRSNIALWAAVLAPEDEPIQGP